MHFSAGAAKKRSASVILFRPRSVCYERTTNELPHARQPTVLVFNRNACERSSIKSPKKFPVREVLADMETEERGELRSSVKHSG